jgi:hypothetical protein
MPRDIYTEPEDFDLDTLRNLGPLAGLAGTWEGQGVDTHPVAEGTEDEPVPRANGLRAAYEQDTVLRIAERAEPFHHVDKNQLRRIAPPTPNPVLGAAG